MCLSPRCERRSTTRETDVSVQAILSFGHQVVAVADDDDRPMYAYTLGRTAHDLPELLIAGPLLPHIAQRVLNRVASIASPTSRAGTVEFPAGLVVPRRRVQLVEVDPWLAGLHRVTTMFGSDVRATQIVLAEEGGRWPWETGYDHAVFPQPVHRISDAGAV